MRKNIKSALSLIVAALMLLGMVPSAMAADVEAITAADIARYGNGNSNGRLIEEGMTVSYGDGTNMTRAPYLVDGFHYSAGEIENLSTSVDANLTYEGENNDNLSLATSTGEDTLVLLQSHSSWTWTTTKDTTGTVSLTEKNNIIEITWPTEKSVKRLEMWVYPVGAIDGYEIQYYNGEEWVGEHSTGNLDQTQTAAADTIESRSAAAYIMLFDEVETTGIRFIAKTFKQGVEEAKIAEIVPRSSNDVNLLEFGILTKGYGTTGTTPEGWLNGFGKGSSVNSLAGKNVGTSPYAYGFSIKAASAGRSNWTYRSGTPCFYPMYKYNPNGTINVMPLATTGTTLYYATRLLNSPQKVNKVTFRIKANSIRGYEIWYANDVSPGEANTNWTLAKSVKGTFSEGDICTTYLTEGVAAECWKIVCPDTDIDAAINGIGLYVLDDSEIPSYIESVQLTGALTAGSDVTFSVYSCKNNVPDAKVFFALYSGTTLKSVAVKDLPLSANGDYSTTYTIPADAGDNLSVKAYFWDGVTLKPLLESAVDAVAAAAE